MEEWKLTKIGSLCKRVCSGGTPKSTVDEYYGGGIPWLNTKEVNFNRIYSTESTISESGLRNSSAKWIDKHAVIVAMYGATAAKCAIGMIPMTTNQACCNLMIDESKADYRFVYYSLTDSYSILASLANGGAQQNLNAQLIKDFEIPLPDLRTQRRIANILSTIDDKIENNNRINHNLEEQAQALYRSWFVDFKPFKSGKFVDSELGLIPDGWHVGTLSELVEVRYGKDHKMLNDGRIPVYGSGGLMRYADRSLFESESVLIPRKGTLNNVMYVNHPFWTVDTMFYTIGKTEHVIKYAHLFLLTQDLASMNAGSAVPSMTTDILNKLPILIPTLEVLNTFDTVVSSVYSIIRSDQVENASLASIRDSILPQLMSGVIDINSLNC